ncbi:ATP-binding protein [Leptolyngbya sp. PCC 6406]|uniref:ATP-binding protein n=1 Tax=Leptolyngbya sp. PCC 6406 TaxID=1173264 RepID=UPI0002ABD51F|nr:ATP-binding protein [Leptolyngbya sp. PCC 6406]
MTVSTPSPLFPEDAPAARCDLPIGGELFQPQGNPDLVFTLTSQGRIASLGWPLAEHCDLSLSQFLGKDLSDLVAESEREPLERILALLWQRETPTLDPCELVLDAYRLQGSLHLYPLPPPAPRPGMGIMTIHQVTSNPDIAAEATPQNYNRKLTQITWNIRRTLDLDTIWQQTVDGLGNLFAVDRGLICPYQPGATDLTVVAEYCQPHLSSWQGRSLPLAHHPCMRKALTTPQPMVEVWDTTVDEEGGRIMLVVATRYQEQPNALIIMHLADDAAWSSEELDLVSELADQVGTAIAHASLFSESQSLTEELQAVNDSLRQKHEELEEARRQAEEASRLKSEFLANTSHELRTPLNGMIGFLRLILDGMADDPEEQKEFLDEAHNSALHLLNLINDVLDIAKIEAGKMQIDMVPLNLRELLQAVENFTRPQAERKGLAFEISFPPTRDEIILQGNYQRLLQVILNLVGNAIKFTHEGSVTISAEVKLQKVTFQNQEWPGTVKISVEDTGIGVSLEKQDRLFQTFSQVDGERTRQYGGTGLGLAISQKLVEAMGGVVKFISMGEGLGSTVTFTVLLYQEPVLIDTEDS